MTETKTEALPQTLEVHAIHTLPPGRVNRGEDGAPKSITFGGVPRVRISSQSQKRRQRTAGELRSVRSKYLAVRLSKHLGDQHERLIAEVLGAAFGGLDEHGALKVMPFVGEAEVAAMEAALAADLPGLTALSEAVGAADGKKAVGAAEEALRAALQAAATRLRPGVSVGTDVALYGRMVAEDTNWNVEAATSYAHAISVHRAQAVSDFFSAIDDVTGKSQHIGETELTAPTMYRMAVLDLRQLARTLGPDAPLADIARTWVQGFVRAIPQAGGHGAFSQSLPEYVMLVARDGSAPLNLSAAFVPALFNTAEQTVPEQAVARLRALHADYAESFGDESRAFDMGVIRGLEYSAASLDEAIRQALGQGGA